MSREAGGLSSGQGPHKPRTAWEAPVLKRFKLTDEELALLRQADDPMALFLKMKPEVEQR